VCTFIYYMPAMVVAPVAAAVLLHRERCRAAGVAPIWARVPRPARPTKQVVLLKKVPTPLVPPIYYKGVSLPDAIQELADSPGAVWPPRPAPRRERVVPFTLGEDVDRLLYGNAKDGRAPARGAQDIAARADAAAAAAALSAAAGPFAPRTAAPRPVAEAPQQQYAGDDWRTGQLENTLGRAQAGLTSPSASPMMPLAAAMPPASRARAPPPPQRVAAGGAAMPPPAMMPAALQGAAAAAANSDGAEGMAAVRARFAAMQSQLKTGAEQAATDAASRQY
jgi:hypothetical protein